MYNFFILANFKKTATLYKIDLNEFQSISFYIQYSNNF